MIGDAKRHEIILGKDETCAAFLGRATNAPPIRVAVATIKIVVDNQKRFLALALNVINVAGLNEKRKFGKIVSRKSKQSVFLKVKLDASLNFLQFLFD